MRQKNEVSHRGIVKSVNNGCAIVSITVNTGCASCDIKGSCSIAETKEKELSIENIDSSIKVGQLVLVRMKTSQGFWALFYGYILPLILLISTMIVTSNITDDEALVGIASLAILIPYFFGLWTFKNRIKKKFNYIIEKTF